MSPLCDLAVRLNSPRLHNRLLGPALRAELQYALTDASVSWREPRAFRRYLQPRPVVPAVDMLLVDELGEIRVATRFDLPSRGFDAFRARLHGFGPA
jgi:hypothetical protein